MFHDSNYSLVSCIVHLSSNLNRESEALGPSDSFDSDSVELMTPLTTPIFDFHLVIGALTSPPKIKCEK